MPFTSNKPQSSIVNPAFVNRQSRNRQLSIPQSSIVNPAIVNRQSPNRQ